jgi:hypothetical protein
VFTVWYTMSPYIKQIRFIFKGLNFAFSFLRFVRLCGKLLKILMKICEINWLEKLNWLYNLPPAEIRHKQRTLIIMNINGNNGRTQVQLIWPLTYHDRWLPDFCGNSSYMHNNKTGFKQLVSCNCSFTLLEVLVYVSHVFHYCFHKCQQNTEDAWRKFYNHMILSNISRVNVRLVPAQVLHCNI